MRRQSKKRAAKDREAKATFGKALGPCEMLPFLGGVRAWHSWLAQHDGNLFIDGRGWEIHHVFGQPAAFNVSWNRMTVCPVAHDFEDKSFGTAGLVICLMALKKRGDLQSDEFYLETLGWSPLGKVSNWLEDGLFLADAERRIVGEPVLRRYAEQLVEGF